MKQLLITATFVLLSHASAEGSHMLFERSAANGWVNEKTGQVEYIKGLPPADKWCEFLPQHESACVLFQVLVGMGKPPEIAAATVFEVFLGIKGGQEENDAPTRDDNASGDGSRRSR